MPFKKIKIRRRRRTVTKKIRKCIRNRFFCSLVLQEKVEELLTFSSSSFHLPPEANGRLRKREDDDNNLKEEGEKEGKEKGAKPFIFLARQPDLITAGIVCYLFLNLLFNIFSFFYYFFLSCDYAQMQSAD
jgi:hypothetical protein